MFAKRSFWLNAGTALLGLVWWGAINAAPSPAAEEQVLHAVLVMGTNDPQIGESVEVDQKNLETFFEQGFKDHKDSLDLKVFKGKDFTRKKVMTYLSDLTVKPEDSVVFYFCGHGGYQPGLGHLLQMEVVEKNDKGEVVKGEILLRSDLRSTLAEKHARLCVVISDACNSYPPGAEVKGGGVPEWKTMRSLFLQSRGFVDINSVSEGENAFGDRKHGGFFTGSLTATLSKPFADLDFDKDGFVHWYEVLPMIQAGAQEAYATFRFSELKNIAKYIKDLPPDSEKEKKELMSIEKTLKDQPNHSVRVFSLSSVLRFGVRVVEDKEGVMVAMVHEYTPAASAGLKHGDRIRSIAGQPIQKAADLDNIIAKSKGDVVLDVKVKRAGADELISLTVKLAPWESVGKEN